MSVWITCLIVKAIALSPPAIPMCGVPSEYTYFSRVLFPGRCLGLVCDAPSAPLIDEVGSVLDREVDFPLAGYAGPGFHTWPSGHIPQDTASKPLFRIRPPAKKDVRRGVRRRRCSRVRWPRFPQLAFGPHPSRQWLRNRFFASGRLPKKTFGEAFGAATGVSDPRLQTIRIRNN